MYQLVYTYKANFNCCKVHVKYILEQFLIVSCMGWVLGGHRISHYSVQSSSVSDQSWFWRLGHSHQGISHWAAPRMILVWKIEENWITIQLLYALTVTTTHFPIEFICASASTLFNLTIICRSHLKLAIILIICIPVYIHVHNVNFNTNAISHKTNVLSQIHPNLQDS